MASISSATSTSGKQSASEAYGSVLTHMAKMDLRFVAERLPPKEHVIASRYTALS